MSARFDTRVVALVGLAMLASLLVRTSALDTGFWIDEGISVGIASMDVADIPRALRQDGSPPLYYVLLHGWMELAGTSEAATRALSLVFAVLAVPASWWAGREIGDARTGALAAAGAAGCPFLTLYAQETRMYSLVALLSVLASASFVLAFLRGRRRHTVLLGLWLALLLYTHTWGVFLAAAMAGAWVWLWRAGRVRGGDGALLWAAVALAYAPWVPTLLFQSANTAAPWSERPGALELLGIPGGLFGHLAAPLLLAAVLAGLRARPAPDAAIRALAGIGLVATGLAFACAQIQPAWATRYTAVLLGPLLLALAAAIARGPRWTAAALAVVGALWLIGGSPPPKSNVRTVAGEARPELAAGDVVVSTQPEQVPVLHRYLPRDVLFVTPLGVVGDPRRADWRDGVARLRAGQAQRDLLPLLASLRPGRRVLLVTPVTGRSPSQAPWSRSVRVRTREWRAALRAHPHLRRIARTPRSASPVRRSAVRTELFEVV